MSKPQVYNIGDYVKVKTLLIGKVVESSNKYPLRPKIKILYEDIDISEEEIDLKEAGPFTCIERIVTKEELEGLL